MPITDSIGQLIEGVSFVFGRLCSCHSVIALGGQFSWNWSKVAVNRDLLNVERAVWFPVFWTCHRPHHVSGVRGPGNGSLFFRWIAYVIYSGSCLIPLRRSPSATAIITHNTRQQEIHVLLVGFQDSKSYRTGGRSAEVAASDLVVEVISGNTNSHKAHTDIHYILPHFLFRRSTYRNFI